MEIFLIVAIIIAGSAYTWYSKIIVNKNQVLECLSDIDVQQQKRIDLIPNIIKLVKRFMQHEADLITRVTELRTEVQKKYSIDQKEDIRNHLEAVQSLDSSLGQLMIAVENYPELKSQENMLQVQRTMNEIEEQLAAARRFYNTSVSSLNNSMEIFPGNYLAKFAKVQSMPFYKADAAAEEHLNLDELLH